MIGSGDEFGIVTNISTSPFLDLNNDAYSDLLLGAAGVDVVNGGIQTDGVARLVAGYG